MKNENTRICAAFCGAGKSYLSSHYPEKYQEVECWEYRDGDFPSNYIEDVKKRVGKIECLFISPDPVILKELHNQGYEMILVYPEDSLKEEYMKRYCDRNSSYDFIGVMYKHWQQRLDGLKEQNYCTHIILKSGQYAGNFV